MTPKAFISYSSEDTEIANKIVMALEVKGLQCWLAPRDVPYGTFYAAAIVAAIRSSNVFVLVLTRSANRSPHVLNEVERAASHGVPILPFVIEEVELTDALEFFISSTHWLRASPSDMEVSLQHLVKAVAAIFQGKGRTAWKAPESADLDAGSAGRVEEDKAWEKDTQIPDDYESMAEYQASNGPETTSKSGRKWILASVVILLSVIALYQGASFLLDRSGRLYVVSKPEGALVELLNYDGDYRAGLSLDEGQYRIRVSHAGYEPREEWVKVEAGRDTRVDFVLLSLPEKIEKTYGRLFVKTVPVGAVVRILDREAGFTPGLRVQTGPCKIEVSHPGYETRVESVSIEKDRDNKFFIDLSGPGFINSAGMEFVLIPSGTFLMGGGGDSSGGTDETEHQVKISRPFYLEATEVTLGQWKTFIKDMGPNYLTLGEAKMVDRAKNGGDGQGRNTATWRNPGFPQNDDHPVTCISWLDAQDFIKWLNDREGLENCEYRLPTEAEWEYALRAGQEAQGFGKDDSESACRYGNVGDIGSNPDLPQAFGCDDGYRYTAPVKSYLPNNSGLYDMLGNVGEWCRDWYDAYPADPVIDPEGPEEGLYKIQRGGSYAGNKKVIGPSYRGLSLPEEALPFNGLRLVRDTCPDPEAGTKEANPDGESFPEPVPIERATPKFGGR